MALIVVHDIKLKRDRIINTDYIFHCFQEEGGVRINFSEGGSGGRGHCDLAGNLDDLAKAIGAVKIG